MVAQKRSRGASTGTSDQPQMRADARRNRKRLLAAAHDVIAERGVNVPLEEIAARAEVGIGTLYRRFPTRKALIEPIIANLVAEYRPLVNRAISDPDAWHGLRVYLVRAVQMQVANRGLTEAISNASPIVEDQAAQIRQETRSGHSKMMRRAKADGELRSDFSLSDFEAIFWACSSVAEASAGVDRDFWRRHLGFVLDGMRAKNPSRMPTAPLTRKQMDSLKAADRQ